MSGSEALRIAPAGAADMTDLARALGALSADLGDAHGAGEDELARACLGPAPACHGFLARAGREVAGAALVSPVFSTTRGGAGAYVSDLWVAQARRGQGVGRALLGAVARAAGDLWGARFVKLTVYDDNPAARAFYERLGFAMALRDRTCLLGGDAFDRILGEPA